MKVVTARWGTKYCRDYTEALRVQCPGLVCLGDDRPLMSNLTSWWVKLEAFAPWNADLRPCLWVDLDTYVFDLSWTDDLNWDELWMIDDFNHPVHGESGLMIVPDTDLTDLIWAGAQTQDPGTGDASYIRQFPHRRLNRVVDGIRSYKLHCRDELPADTKICCFHGKPKPHETDGWALKHWNTLLSQTTKS